MAEVLLFAGAADIPGFLGPALLCLKASCPWIERTTVVTPAVDVVSSVVGSLPTLGFQLRTLSDQELAPEATGLPA